MKNLIIIGISSTANDVYNFIIKYQLYNVIGFAVNSEYKTNNQYLGLPVFELENIDNYCDKNHDYLFVAIQWNRLNADRRHVYENLKIRGYQFANIISPHACINGTINGDNCWISDMVCIDNAACIGNDTFVKSCALLGSHAQISDHCFIGAKSTIGGGCIIGEQSFIGLGAVVFDEVKIGTKCIVGAATALKRNLKEYSVYKTTSDVFISKQYDESDIESKLLFKKNIR